MMFLLIFASACGNGAPSVETADNGQQLVVSENETGDMASDLQNSENADDMANADDANTEGKQLIVYFPNWRIGRTNGEVSDIPWDKVTIINHAFWKITPSGDSQESSFIRRDNGDEPRTDFFIESSLWENDEIIFKDYEKYHELYPDVKILISIGGWSCSGYFSEMAYTPEGRKSFVDSCIDLMDTYPWIAGIDIDWEYPGGSNDGERLSEGGNDQGCPIWGTSYDDRLNFAALLKEMREAFYSHYEGGKLLTACASASTGWTLPNQDWVSAAEFVDYINIMTYDLAGKWDGITGHASSVSGTKNGMAYFIIKKIDASKLNIGSPFYGTGFLIKEGYDFSRAVGAPLSEDIFTEKDILTMPYIRELEKQVVADGEKGWHKGYDSKPGGAYLYNDDESSEQYRWYISYETTESLDGKFELVNKYKLAAMIVWEVTEDTEDHELINYMSEALLAKR